MYAAPITGSTLKRRSAMERRNRPGPSAPDLSSGRQAHAQSDDTAPLFACDRAPAPLPPTLIINGIGTVPFPPRVRGAHVSDLMHGRHRAMQQQQCIRSETRETPELPGRAAGVPRE